LDSNNKILSFIGIVCYAPIMTLMFIAPFSFIGMIIISLQKSDNLEEEEEL